MKLLGIKLSHPNWTLILFGIGLYVAHFSIRDPSDPYQRPIISDAKGYYAYLPAIFIYQDMEYSFLSEMDKKYYAVGHEKHIFIEVGDEKVNKTFPGVAILYLPFFLIAHFLASILGYAADGYSNIYQYLFDFGQFFYATLGMIFALKVLTKLKISSWVAVMAIIFVMLGSNAFYYIAFDQSVTHIYNFCLINVFIYSLLKYKKDRELRDVVIAVTVFSLILIVRPTGVLSILLAFALIPNLNFWKLLVKQLLKPINMLKIAVVTSCVFVIPLWLWKIQSGYWIVYSYGEEGFDFFNPEIYNFLFSYQKGWFLWSPFLLFVLILGLPILFKENKSKVILLITFLSLAVWIFSSWWCWYYGFSFGQRPMVDFYIMFVLLMAYIIKSLDEVKVYLKMLFGVLVLLCVFLNLFQSMQHYKGFYKTPIPTSEMYWDNFLSFRKKSKVYIESDWRLVESYYFDFETQVYRVDGDIFNSEDAFSGKMVIGTMEKFPFSAVTYLSINEMISHVVVSFKVRAETSLSKTDLVMEYKGSGKSYRSFGLDQYVCQGKWSTIEIMYDVKTSKDTLVLYFWNRNSSQRAFVDDLQVDFYTK